MPNHNRDHAQWGIGAVLFLCALILLVICGAGFVTYRSGRASLGASIEEQLAHRFAETKSGVERALSTLVEILESWAGQPVMARIFDDDADHEIAELLEVVVQRSSILMELTCANASGTVIASTNPAKLGKSLSLPAKTWERFQGGLRYTFAPIGEVARVTVPIFMQFDQREFVGVLQATVEPGSLLTYKLPWWSGLTTPSGDVFVQSGVAFLEHVAPDTSDYTHPQFGRLFIRAAAVAFPTGGTGPEWHIVIAEPYDTLFRQLNVLRTMFVSVTGGCMVLTTVLVVAFFRRQRVLLTYLAAQKADLENEIAERKRTEAELRKLSLAIEQSPASIVITDTQGTIEYVNPMFCEITGYTAEEAIGQNPRILKSGNKPRESYKKLWDTILAGRVWTGTFENRKKNGELYWEEASICPIRNAEGAITHFLAVKQDITERKKMENALRASEAELRKHRDHLEELVSERTAELAKINDALVHEIEYRKEAEKAAEAASRAKSEFLAVMSHELRTPLNGVISMNELLLATELNEQQRRYAWLAKKSGDVLLELINDILDFSKIEAGKVELEYTGFDLQQVVESVGITLAPKAESKGLELVCSCHPQVPRFVRGDPGRLQQILINLTNNAIKFTERGEVVVRACVDEQREEEVIIRFTVTDTGIGIPPDRIDRLFESFSQADSSTTRRYGGTGLGLAICKQLVELMGGRIGVVSEPGRGSTFWFTVKLSVGREREKDPASVFSDLRSVRILAVDDNATNREIIGEQLTGAGLEFAAAADAREALHMLREAVKKGTPFGLALIDMQMPEMDGEQLARAIKADPRISDTVLLLLTSVGQWDERRLRSAGFAAWMTKPIRQSQLVNAMAEAMLCAVADTTQARKSVEEPSKASRRERSTESDARILLVEDNEIAREATAAILAQGGFRCETAEDGRRGVEAVLAKRYDLVLMDCQMPVMDGFEATRTIRKHEKEGALPGGGGKRLPIIALTANAIKGDRERCLEAGMDDYLTKPLDPDRLIEVLDSYLRGGAGDPNDESVEASIGEAGEPPAPVQGPPPPFDHEALRKRWGTDRRFVEQLIVKFQNRAGEYLAGIEKALDAGDAEKTADAAHSLKGAAAYLEAGGVRDLAARLEQMGRSGDLGDAHECLKQLRDEVKRCLEYVPTGSVPVGTR